MKNLLTLIFLIAFTQITHATPDDFIITIKTDNYGVSNINQFTLPINPDEIYDYAVDCDNDGIVEASGLTGAYTCDYAQAGIYTIRIIHDAVTGEGFPALSFYTQYPDVSDNNKLISVDQWGTAKWTNMSYAFSGATNVIIAAIDTPDFSNVFSMKGMFSSAFNANPDTQNWDVSSVIDMSYMFELTQKANPDTHLWDVSSVANMRLMFYKALAANPDVYNWDVSSVTDIAGIFAGDYNSLLIAEPDMSQWDTSSVTNMGGAFSYLRNVGDISNWDTSSVTDMAFMFYYAGFKNDIALHWDTSKVTNMQFMFHNLSYTSASLTLDNWDVSSVLDMKWMFRGNFIGTEILGKWNVSSVTDMSYMFSEARNIIIDTSNWNLESLQTMEGMFFYAENITLDISQWHLPLVAKMNNAFDHFIIPSDQYDSFLINLSLYNPYSGLNLAAVYSQYCSATAENARIDLVNRGWHISDLGKFCLGNNTDDFIITIVGNAFTIPINSSLGGYNYSVDCDNDGILEASSIQTDYTCNYGSYGKYTIAIKHDASTGLGFPAFQFGINNSNAQKLRILNNWGTSRWQSMGSAFKDVQNMWISANDVPNLSEVANFSSMFENASLVNPDVSLWDTSSATNMSRMFRKTSTTLIDANNWDTSLVTDMSYVFSSHQNITLNIDQWDTSSVTDMTGMFAYHGAINNLNLNLWDTSSVISMSEIFKSNRSLKQLDISQWDTSSVVYMDNAFSNLNNLNLDLNLWNTANVINMSNLFKGSKGLTLGIDQWDVTSVDDMSQMFLDAENLILDLSQWVTSSLTNMTAMFENSDVSSQIAVWDTSNVSQMQNLFKNYKGVISAIQNWVYTTVTDMTDMLLNNKLSTSSYDALLIKLSNDVTQSNVTFNVGESFYCSANAIAARDILTLTYNWTIQDAGQDCRTESDFVIKVKTDNTGTSSDTQFTIAINPSLAGYNYSVDCDNDGVYEIELTQLDYTCNYLSAGAYTVRISHDEVTQQGFPSLFINNAGDRLKLISIEQWGKGIWTDMSGAFYGAENLVINASDKPDFTQVIDMTDAFYGVSLPFAVYDEILINLSESSINSNILLHGGTSHYCSTEAIVARNLLTNNQNWQITDSGWQCYKAPVSDFVFVVRASGVTINTLNNPGFDFNIDCGNNGIIDAFNVSYDYACNFPLGGNVYNEIRIENGLPNGGGFPFLQINGADYGYNPLNAIVQWGTGKWQRMDKMFKYADHVVFVDTNSPDTSELTSMYEMFANAYNIDIDMSQWDLSSVTNMSKMFSGASNVSIDSSGWNASSVTDMSNMFSSAHDLLIDTSGWNTSSVTDMTSMFSNAYDLSFDISGWNTSSVTNMRYIYTNSSNAPIALDTWDVSSLLYLDGAFINTSLPIQKYDNILINFAGQNVNSFVQLDVGDTQYCNLLAADARFILVETYNWTINDGGYCGYMFKDGFE